MKIRKISILMLIVASIAVYSTAIAILYNLTKDARLDPTKLPGDTSHIRVLDSTGNSLNVSEYASIEEIPERVKNAFIAMEDSRFYMHFGIDPIRIAGATAKNVKTGKYTQGGSTITCQLVKNTHLSNEKTLKRKLQEAKIAIEIEKEYSKNKILEMYLNVLYFGNGIYGVKNASKVFFEKTLNDLSIEETAALVATIASPATYSPLSNLTENTNRRNIVLARMERLGYISFEDCKDAQRSQTIIKYGKFHNNYSDNCYKLIQKEAQELLAMVRNKRIQYPITIESYIDRETQKLAESIYISSINESTESRMILADNHTGGIVAYAGSISPFSSPRQQGSTLKPFIYATAIEENRVTTQTQFNDTPRSFGNYSPANYKNKYYGWISAQTALSSSSNTIAVELLNETGVEDCCRLMQHCGLTLDDKDHTLALALGGTTYGSTPIELATAYMTLANQGVKQDISFIKKITDSSGRTIYEKKTQYDNALSPSSAYITTEMLKETVRSGTASQLSHLNIPIAAKTGTVAKAGGNSDAWVVGYTTQHTFLYWYGAKDGTTMPNTITGGNQPTKSIRTLLAHIYENNKPQDFPKPADVRYVSINSEIKERFHVLIPSSVIEVGPKEKIPISEGFTFDSIDKGEFYLKDLSFSGKNKDLYIEFKRVPEVTYSVYVDSMPCKEENGTFISHRKTNAFAKVEIVCMYRGETVYEKSRLIIPY